MLCLNEGRMLNNSWENIYELAVNEKKRERGSSMKDITQKYLKSVKKLFPIYGKMERQYIKNLQTPLQEYAEEKEDLSYEELTEEFGTPYHVISEYFSEVDEEYLFRQLRIRGYVKKFLIFVVIAFLAFNGYCYYWAYQDYLNAQDQHIMYKEIIIEEN